MSVSKHRIRERAQFESHAFAMIGKLFRKDPRKDLQRRYERLMQEARDQQRGGDVVAAAAKTAAADELRKQLDALDAEHG